MPRFSEASNTKKAGCHMDLQRLANRVIETFDCSVITGYRGQADQDKAFAEKKSKLKFPFSQHNRIPAMAIDIAPFIDGKIAWTKTQCLYFAGYVKGIADGMGVKIRSGSDWDSDYNIDDQEQWDICHFELEE